MKSATLSHSICRLIVYNFKANRGASFTGKDTVLQTEELLVQTFLQTEAMLPSCQWYMMINHLRLTSWKSTWQESLAKPDNGAKIYTKIVLTGRIFSGKRFMIFVFFFFFGKSISLKNL